MGNVTAAQAATKSLTHWAWTPFRDINNMGPHPGLRSLLGYRQERWSALKRCVPYPLSNIVWQESDREAVAEAHSSGFSLNPTAVPMKEWVKYAQDQANELGETYGNEGLRILVPLIGIDDQELVGQIIQAVQPFEYALHEMPAEFTEGAKSRIKKSNLSDAHQRIATNVAKVMLNGANKAIEKALAEYEALITSMSDAQVGKPGISNPSPAHQSHVWICQQLNKPVPARVNRMTEGSGNNEAINILAKRALREETAAESMAAELAQEREARAKLEEKVDLLLAAQESPKQPRQARA
jgi:hypothetical protein